MNKLDRHIILKMITNLFLEVVIKIEVKDNNVEQALRVLKENSRETVFLK